MYHVGKCPMKYNCEQDLGEFHEYTHHNTLESCGAVDNHDDIDYKKLIYWR